jgi:hypothetical protein
MAAEKRTDVMYRINRLELVETENPPSINKCNHNEAKSIELPSSDFPAVRLNVN